MRTCLSPVLKGDYEELHLVGLNDYADAGVHFNGSWVQLNAFS